MSQEEGKFSFSGMTEDGLEEGVSLLKETFSSFRSHQSNPCRKKTFTLISTLFPWLLNAVLSTALLVLTARPSHCSDPSQSFYSPVQDEIEYQETIFTRGFGHHLSPYQGWPNDEKDKLWQDLYSKGAFLRVSPSEHSRMANKTEHVPVPGLEDEYLVGLDVFHQLHCLNMLREGVYPHRYNTSLIEPDGKVNYMKWMHIDHCIESVRQHLTCHSDISLIFYKWLPEVKKLQPMLDGVHTCRDFSKIHDWAWNRSAPVSGVTLHVEGGRIINYSDVAVQDVTGPNAGAPEGWNYTFGDL